jgi:hypothetical protein
MHEENMRQMKTWGGLLLMFCFTLLATSPLQAQAPAAGEKPPIYIYSADWAVPRAQWGDMEKLDASERPLLDKLVADGTLISYGSYSNLIHQEGEFTHGSWFTATSEGNLLKALEAIYAQPSNVLSPVQGASKHWDSILTGSVYNQKPGSYNGYLTWSVWQVKQGQGQAYANLMKTQFVPVLEKLLAEGTITTYGLLTEDYHTDKVGRAYDFFTVPDAASLDKANKAIDDLIAANPDIMNSRRTMVDTEGHRDYLVRLRSLKNK